MDSTSLLLLALAFVIAVAISGGTNVLWWLLVGFLLASGAYAAWMLFSRRSGTLVILGRGEKKAQ